MATRHEIILNDLHTMWRDVYQLNNEVNIPRDESMNYINAIWVEYNSPHNTNRYHFPSRKTRINNDGLKYIIDTLFRTANGDRRANDYEMLSRKSLQRKMNRLWYIIPNSNYENVELMDIVFTMYNEMRKNIEDCLNHMAMGDDITQTLYEADKTVSDELFDHDVPQGMINNYLRNPYPMVNL